MKSWGVEKHGGYTNGIGVKLKKFSQTENKLGSLENSAHLCGMKTESQPKLDALELARIRASLSRSAESYRESGDDMDACSWGMEHGVLISANDAQRISDAIHALFGFLSNPAFAQAPAMYAAMKSFCTDFENDYIARDGLIVGNPREILVKNYNSFNLILAAARGEGDAESAGDFSSVALKLADKCPISICQRCENARKACAGDGWIGCCLRVSHEKQGIKLDESKVCISGTLAEGWVDLRSRWDAEEGSGIISNFQLVTKDCTACGYFNESVNNNKKP